ncbi:MAG: hypothetical protein ACR2NG_04735 [Acidimicrobiia bacterium]
MKSAAIIAVALALLVAACSGSADDSVASLSSTTTTAAASTGQLSDGGTTDEDAILAFAACMRENGIEDFEDPTIDADGRIEFGGGFGGGAGGDGERADREALRAARDICQENLEGLAFGPGNVDRSEIEDQLYEFAACMRDNGYNMPDPDFSAEPGEGGGGGPFGGDVDPADPAFQEALEACEAAFGGNLRFGRGRPAGGGQESP